MPSKKTSIMTSHRRCYNVVYFRQFQTRLFQFVQTTYDSYCMVCASVRKDKQRALTPSKSNTIMVTWSPMYVHNAIFTLYLLAATFVTC